MVEIVINYKLNSLSLTIYNYWNRLVTIIYVNNEITVKTGSPFVGGGGWSKCMYAWGEGSCFAYDVQLGGRGGSIFDQIFAYVLCGWRLTEKIFIQVLPSIAINVWIIYWFNNTYWQIFIYYKKFIKEI